jgi:hypothetical protein
MNKVQYIFTAIARDIRGPSWFETRYALLTMRELPARNVARTV